MSRSGNLPGFPALPTRTIRVFVSSTFGDLKAERNELQKRVFPRLRRYCERLGWAFQAIDLRWGVSTEAALDQGTMRICLAEIARCQDVTPRPNFLILMGNRYGWRPLPAEIPAAEFAVVSAELAPCLNSLAQISDPGTARRHNVRVAHPIRKSRSSGWTGEPELTMQIAGRHPTPRGQGATS